MSLCLTLVTFVKKLKLVPNIVRDCPVARNWRQKNSRKRLEKRQLRKVF